MSRFNESRRHLSTLLKRRFFTYGLIVFLLIGAPGFTTCTERPMFDCYLVVRDGVEGRLAQIRVEVYIRNKSTGVIELPYHRTPFEGTSLELMDLNDKMISTVIPFSFLSVLSPAETRTLKLPGGDAIGCRMALLFDAPNGQDDFPKGTYKVKARVVGPEAKWEAISEPIYVRVGEPEKRVLSDEVFELKSPDRR